jgi:hypothetical protein
MVAESTKTVALRSGMNVPAIANSAPREATATPWRSEAAAPWQQSLHCEQNGIVIQSESEPRDS